MSRRRSSASDDLPLWVYLVLLAAVIALLVGIHHRWESDCEAKGGHWRDVSRSGVCVSPDGRILD